MEVANASYERALDSAYQASRALEYEINQDIQDIDNYSGIILDAPEDLYPLQDTADLNLALAKRLEGLFSSAGIGVELTRATDHKVGPEQRVLASEDANAALLISISHRENEDRKVIIGHFPGSSGGNRMGGYLAEEIGDRRVHRIREMVAPPGQTLSPLYQVIAMTLEHHARALSSGNAAQAEWTLERLTQISRFYLPSGSGIDAGVEILIDDTAFPDRIAMRVPYHHMGESGMYAGWLDYLVIVRPSLSQDFELEVSDDSWTEELLAAAEEEGLDPDGIMDYLADVFNEVLAQMVPRYGDR